MTTDDESHILRTTSKRLVKGLVIIVGIMIVGNSNSCEPVGAHAFCPPTIIQTKT